jgi:hypothetical protein
MYYTDKIDQLPRRNGVTENSDFFSVYPIITRVGPVVPGR